MRNDEDIIENGKIWDVQDMGIVKSGLIKLPDSKRASVVWSRDENGWEHISVAPMNQFVLPTWDDMAYLKALFFDEEEEAYQIMPRKSEYVNIKSNCLHIWRLTNGRMLNELL